MKPNLWFRTPTNPQNSL